MATESTRRALTEAQRERVAVPRRPRRAAALLLQRTAHRLDPYVTRAPPRHARALSSSELAQPAELRSPDPLRPARLDLGDRLDGER